MNFKKQDWVGRDPAGQEVGVGGFGRLVSFYMWSCWSCNSLSWT
jgi:hypothetical protein